MRPEEEAIIKATDEAADKVEVDRETFMALHQHRHCQQIQNLELQLASLATAVGALSSVLIAKGVVNAPELLAELEGKGQDIIKETEEENWN
jgi:hypothetical protein